MSRNGKTGKNRHKGKRPAGKSGAVSPAHDSVSLSTFRVGRALDALTPAFVQWFDDGSPGAAPIALGCLKQVESVLGRYMDSTAAADVTVFEPVPLAVAVTDEVVAAAGSGSSAGGTAEAGDAGFVVSAIYTYIDFLSDTGRWSGTAEQLAGVLDFLDAIGQQEDDGAGVIGVPDVPEQEALDELSRLPLVRRATALLEWIGDGRPVTGTGALRLRDIEAAAACVGVAARGGTKRAGAPLPGTAGAADVPTVRSMYEVPLLAQMWAALETAELIKITSTKAVPFEGVDAFLAGGPSERLEELVFFVDSFLMSAVLDYDPEQPWERIVAGLQASILIAAATDDPPLLERVLAAPDAAPAEEKAMTRLFTDMAVDRLNGLADLGLLTIDTHFRVPPALIRCVANVFDDEWVLAGLGLAPAPDAGDEHRLPGASWAGTPVLQLRILLNGSKPPIWRRVLVPSGMPLPQFHEVIQALFGWLGYHLHEFRIGGSRGPAYAPVNPDGEAEFYGEAARDESTVTVGDLLPAVGSTMTYTYDFGDNWVHGIKVEKILAGDDDGGQLPRCTAGRGAPPAEDSGGTWGWSNIVQAVNDPRHADHKEYREWLGMLPGDALDPHDFDQDEVNEELAHLF
ncbi:plasmid pRiA4b ORF-3 family protein [Arthrobacter sp. PM3]|uniref:plasmid pRiA4b ORF-3 family protein n=1 Tax=Arthrobacter sp. PM3 TaxID=2017685 RepID=UPI000E10307B|nr:plasmid pRiA4b ORF-3 family protein [Arthrobacter sp. PM3]AXJ09136.1 hypothetical protein CFN17_05530 [Arthrobacter sp. PM3]